MNRHQKATGERTLAAGLLHEGRIEVERAGGIVRSAHIEHAAEVGKVVSHVSLQKR
jgi:hypothetical protein